MQILFLRPALQPSQQHSRSFPRWNKRGMTSGWQGSSSVEFVPGSAVMSDELSLEAQYLATEAYMSTRSLVVVMIDGEELKRA